MIGATAIKAPRTSSAVRLVFAAAARFSKYEPGGAFTAASAVSRTIIRSRLYQVGTLDRVRCHVEHGVEQGSFVTHWELLVSMGRGPLR